MKNIELRKVPCGETFTAFGEEYVVLDHVDGGVLSIRKGVWKRAPFDRMNNSNLSEADIREDLDDYFQLLKSNGAEDSNLLIQHVDLKATDGTRVYGYLDCTVALLTLEQYGKYKEIIPKVDGAWWLATPVWTRWLRSPGAGSTGGVWYVYSHGGCNYWYANNSLGVRPALILPSTLLVSDDGSITTNTAPTTPSSITIPSSISGGSTITVKWGASSDAQGNLAGYKVEKSTNGGSSWSQIYQGSALQTTDNVAFGTQSVMYRVKAYDTEGLESGYKTSNQVTVINNTAPSAPTSITVPLTVIGGEKLTITWAASSDSEGNLVGYILERRVASGSWTQVFKGNALTFQDTITKGWTTVQYRVKAYDTYNAESAYTTSETRTVDNNTAPVITCDQASGTDLGTKSSGFSVSYSVDDEDGDAVTVTESMDGTTKRTFEATLEATNQFQVTGTYFQQLLNGQHTMKMKAQDTGGKSSEYTLLFTKSVTACSITLETPMEADAQITIAALSVSGDIPADANYQVLLTNNAKDAEPVWEDATTEVKNGSNYLFENDTATNGFAFNFKVTASRGASGIGGYISSIQGGFQ